MKKLIVILIWIFLFFSFYQVEAEKCTYTKDNIGISLQNCLSSTTLVQPGNLNIEEGGFNEKIYNITQVIATILSLWAIFWIVYGSFLLVTAAWEDEKIKKWKDVIKWSIIWFLGVVIASSLIVLIVTFFYDIGTK